MIDNASFSVTGSSRSTPNAGRPITTPVHCLVRVRIKTAATTGTSASLLTPASPRTPVRIMTPPVIGTFSRAADLGAPPPNPRLLSPPAWADAGSKPSRHSQRSLVIEGTDRNRLDASPLQGLGQLNSGRYSSQPGGSYFDALLAHFSVTVSTIRITRQVR